ncbi:MAG: hypothetical protein Kow0031_36350 [Anaerolineae bacterium]
MAISDVRSRIKAGVWQAVAQSGVDVSALSPDDANKLVDAITEQTLAAIDDLIGEQAAQTAAGELDVDVDDEEVLWEGRPFLSLSVYYQITSERVRIVEGLLSKTRRDIELVRIQDIDHSQNLTERTLNIGDVTVTSHDTSDPEVTLYNVTDPREVHEILRRAMLKARKKYNVSFREEM